MGLQAEIWAWRLGEGGTKEEEKKEEEKIPHMCESIDYQPLRCRCPKREAEEMEVIYGDHLLDDKLPDEGRNYGVSRLA